MYICVILIEGWPWKFARNRSYKKPTQIPSLVCLLFLRLSYGFLARARPRFRAPAHALVS